MSKDKVESGVNANGVQWVKEGSTYYCSYYLGNGDMLEKAFKDIKQSKVERLTFHDLKLKKT